MRPDFPQNRMKLRGKVVKKTNFDSEASNQISLYKSILCIKNLIKFRSFFPKKKPGILKKRESTGKKHGEKSTGPTVHGSIPPLAFCAQELLHVPPGLPNEGRKNREVPPILPYGSMYGLFTYIWLIFMVNVGKYTIHGAYGYWLPFQIQPLY